MAANDDFVREMTKGLFGDASSHAPARVVETESPAKDSFAQMAVSDLLGGQSENKKGAQVNTKPIDKKDLSEAFDKSVEQPIDIKESSKVIDEFKKEAEEESKSILSKLLRGIK